MKLNPIQLLRNQENKIINNQNSNDFRRLNTVTSNDSFESNSKVAFTGKADDAGNILESIGKAIANSIQNGNKQEETIKALKEDPGLLFSNIGKIIAAIGNNLKLNQKTDENSISFLAKLITEIAAELTNKTKEVVTKTSDIIEGIVNKETSSIKKETTPKLKLKLKPGRKTKAQRDLITFIKQKGLSKKVKNELIELHNTIMEKMNNKDMVYLSGEKELTCQEYLASIVDVLKKSEFKDDESIISFCKNTMKNLENAKPKTRQIQQPETTKIETSIKLTTHSGRKTKAEEDLIKYINMENLSPDAKNELIQLHNALMTNKDKIAYLPNGEKKEISELFKIIVNRLNQVKPNSKEEVHQFCKIYIDSINKSKDIVRTPRKVSGKKYHQQLVQCFMQKYTGEMSEASLKDIKNTIAELENNIKDKNINSSKILKQISKNYSDEILNIAKINQGLSPKERQYLYTKILDGSLKKEEIAFVKDNYKIYKMSFNQLLNLYNEGVTSPEQLKYLSELISNSKITDFRIVHAGLNDNQRLFEFKIPGSKQIPEKFNIITTFHKNVIGKTNTIRADQNTTFNEERIIEALNEDFKRNTYKNNDKHYTTYDNIIKYIFGENYQIDRNKKGDLFDVTTLTKNEKGKLKALISILNDDEIFDPNIFTNHSKLRFIERFTADESATSLKKRTLTALNKIKGLISESLNNGITVKEYDNFNLHAPSLVLKDTNGKNIVITLDQGNKIHTIYYQYKNFNT